jgi:hypothetical protein
LFHIEAGSKTNSIFVRQLGCVGRTQIGNKVMRRPFGPGGGNMQMEKIKFVIYKDEGTGARIAQSVWRLIVG